VAGRTLLGMLMAYDEQGTGPALLLVHSGVCDRRMWQPQWATLSGSFRAVRPDLRGFGETPLPAESFSFAADIVELLDFLDIERACVVGSSFGGRVALELASSAPERVERLVLLCSALPGFPSTPTADAFEEAEEELFELGDIDGAVALNVATWLGPEADSATRELVCIMQRRAFEVQLAADDGPSPPEPVPVAVDPAAIAAPALVVSGAHDMDQFRAVAAHLAVTMPTARHVDFDWAGHLPSLERPEPVTALISEFCR